MWRDGKRMKENEKITRRTGKSEKRANISFSMAAMQMAEFSSEILKQDP